VTSNLDSVENHELWLATVEINLVDPEKDEPVRSYLIAAPDETEAEHILRGHHSPGSLRRVIRLRRAVDNIARVYGSDGRAIDLTTVAVDDVD